MRENARSILTSFSPSSHFSKKEGEKLGWAFPSLPLSFLLLTRKEGKVGGSLLKGMREKGRHVLLPFSLLPFPFEELKGKGGVGLPLTSLPPSHPVNEKYGREGSWLPLISFSRKERGGCVPPCYLTLSFLSLAQRHAGRYSEAAYVTEV